MVIGILQFELLIPGSASLKDKRRVTKSVKDRLHRSHMVSVAEVGSLDMLNHALMGLVCVGSDGGRVGKVLDRCVLELRSLTDAELGDCSRQFIAAEAEGGVAEEPDAEGLAGEMLARASGQAAERRGDGGGGL
jgi:uncharacterized protein